MSIIHIVLSIKSFIITNNLYYRSFFFFTIIIISLLLISRNIRGMFNKFKSFNLNRQNLLKLT